MRIGLLTWWKTQNYGAMLQAYATLSYIKSLGHDVELIDFCQPADCERMFDWREWYSTKYAKLKFCIEYHPLHARKRIQLTRNFLRDYCKASIPCHNFADVERQNYDLIVVGSDQLWSPLFRGSLRINLLEGVEERIPRISFSTSIAAETIPDDLTALYQKCLSKFSEISLRECSLIPFVEKLVGRKVFWSVDPTLLLTDVQWANAFNFQPNESARPPIVAYFLSGFFNYLDELISLTKREDRDVHLYVDLDSLRLKAGTKKEEILAYLDARLKMIRCRRLKLIMAASPVDFVSDIATSYFVVADSFHALMFATIFHKPVRIIVPKSRTCMASRMTGFLKQVGWENVLSSASNNMFEGIDFGRRNEVDLQKWIGDSKSWLENALIKAGNNLQKK